MLVIITDQRELGNQIGGHLFQKGVYFYQTPLETGLFYCEAKDTGGVILDCTDTSHKGDRLFDALRQRYPEMPIAVLCKRTRHSPPPNANLILWDAEPDTLLPHLENFCFDTCGWQRATLSTAYLTVGKDPSKTAYMGCRLKLAPKENELLRCLLYRSPRLTSAEDLGRLCNPFGSIRASTVTIQIRNINLRAAAIDSRPLIVNEYGKGYRLRDGIIL